MIMVNIIELGWYFMLSLGLAALFICLRACLRPALYIFAVILVLRYFFGIHPIFL